MSNAEFLTVLVFTPIMWGLVYLYLVVKEKNKKEQDELNRMENER